MFLLPPGMMSKTMKMIENNPELIGSTNVVSTAVTVRLCSAQYVRSLSSLRTLLKYLFHVDTGHLFLVYQFEVLQRHWNQLFVINNHVLSGTIKVLLMHLSNGSYTWLQF